MLDQLCNFLVELDYVWLLMYKVLNLMPILEQAVSVCPCWPTSERHDHPAEHLACHEGCLLWLLDSQNVPIAI